MNYESPDINSTLLVPNPNAYREYGQIFFPQIIICTADNGDIEEQIRTAMRIEHALGAFCRAEISLEEFFDLSEIYLGIDRIDEYIEEVCGKLEEEFKGLIL